MTHLEMAEALGEMERDIMSWEADLLEFMLKTLRGGKKLTLKQAQSLEAIYEKYFGEKDGGDDRGGEASEESDEGEPDKLW